MSAELIFVNEVIICQKIGSRRKLPELIDTRKCSLSSFSGQPIFDPVLLFSQVVFLEGYFFIFCIRCYIKMVERALDNIYFVLCVRARASDRCKMLLFWGATLWTHVQTILRHVFISEWMDFDPVYYNYLFFSWSLILEPSRYWNCLKSSFTEMFLLLRANSWLKKKKKRMKCIIYSWIMF